MGRRREAREKAIQFLFQHDVNPPENLVEALDLFWETQRAGYIAGEKGGSTWGENVQAPAPSSEDVAVRLFADPLIKGTLEKLAETDALISKYTQNWEIHRMAVVDRNILRLAIFEMLYRDDIPPVVSINEAVDIAKKYSTQESGRFVNGILDSVKSDLMRPLRIVK